MPPRDKDDFSSLEQARARLYKPDTKTFATRSPLTANAAHALTHEWKEDSLSLVAQRSQKAAYKRKHPVRLAGIFFTFTVIFFFIAFGISAYLFYYGGNTVSVDKVVVDVHGPTTIAGGDTVPLSFSITNKNPVAIENATIEIVFPSGTRDASNVSVAYPRYTATIGSLESGATITQSLKVVLFGAAGQTLSLPVSVSYGTVGSSATFVKKSSYDLVISSTPLSVSVDALSETVSGKPLSFVLTVRSNAVVPISNVILTGSFPFGFVVDSSSIPLRGSGFLLGTMQPGSVKTIKLAGTLTGQDKEQRVFHFTVGTANTANDQSIAVSYMTQDATIAVVSPFINTTLAVNGDTRSDMVIAPGSSQNVTVSYTNTLATSISNATIEVAISGLAVDYESIQTNNGFYRSFDHTILFSRDTDSTLSQLAPGASGFGSFSFATLPTKSLASSPTVGFSTSVSGTRSGQTQVPEEVNSTITKTVKVATVVVLSAFSLHTSGPLSTSGPIPPRADQATTYTIAWNVQNEGSAIAGGVVTAILPSYVSYTSITSGKGSFSYNEKAHAVTWDVGDISQKSSAQGFFQVSITPSTSQKGSTPELTGEVSFSGYDRFAGVQISATAEPATTATPQDPGYVSANGSVE